MADGVYLPTKCQEVDVMSAPKQTPMNAAQRATAWAGAALAAIAVLGLLFARALDAADLVVFFGRAGRSRFGVVQRRGVGVEPGDQVAGLVLESDVRLRRVVRGQRLGVEDVEAGMPDLQTIAWSALFAPKSTPKAIVKKLNAAVDKAMHDPSVIARCKQIGADLPPANQRTPQYLGQLVSSEVDKWTPLLKASTAASK